MRSDSTSEHWARMPGNSVHRKPNQLGRKERIGQKRRRPAITDHHALHLCARASSQAIRSLAISVSRAMSEGSVSRAMSEGGRSYLDRQPDVNKRSLAAAIEPGLRLIESIRSRYLDQVQGGFVGTKATSSPHESAACRSDPLWSHRRSHSFRRASRAVRALRCGLEHALRSRRVTLRTRT